MRQQFHWCIYYEIKGFPTPNRTWFFNDDKLLHSEDITDVSDGPLRGKGNAFIWSEHTETLLTPIKYLCSTILKDVWHSRLRDWIAKVSTRYLFPTCTDLQISRWSCASTNTNRRLRCNLVTSNRDYRRCYLSHFYHFRRPPLCRGPTPRWSLRRSQQRKPKN